MCPRDQNYYFKDGSCILQVDGYLFNIHYTLLAQESPVFNKMFSLPQPGSTELELKEPSLGVISSEMMEGSSDDNPIICHDDLDSFRALCWGLYARPIEIRAQQDAATVDLKRLMLLAGIAHKYDCTHLERWSLDIIQSHWTSSFSNAPASRVPEPSGPWTSEILENLLLLSNKSDILDSTFKKNIEVQWLSLAFAPTMSSADLRKSLDFVDRLNNARQRGLAYYRALRRVGITNSSPPALSDFAKMVESSGTPDALMSELTPEQRGRLMRGLWCLNSLQRYSIGSILVNEPHAGCPSTSTHQYHWQSFWTAYQSYSGDPGSLLEMALGRASKRNEWGVACWLELKPKIEQMLHTFEDNLSKYFMVD